MENRLDTDRAQVENIIYFIFLKKHMISQEEKPQMSVNLFLMNCAIKAEKNLL